MAPSPSPRNALTPSQLQTTPNRTPSSKSRLNFSSRAAVAVSPLLNGASSSSAEHPVEVVGRIRDLPTGREKGHSAVQVFSNGATVRVRTELGYREFSLDGVSDGEKEGLEVFYRKFVEARVRSVKTGGKCTVMMYGPTGSGKSHTMFGCPKEPGIVYRALHNIMGEDCEGVGILQHCRFSVNVSVVEIYNEEIYDLLVGNSGGPSFRPNGTRARLEVMGRKVKNAVFISGNNAGKIANEVAKVEKKRVVKSTLCNERSSRSHCLITLDVPAVGGRLMLVDMAGSENIDQAGIVGSEGKLQTAKINQGNIALKRVVEAIANGDSHVPFRDSKLTMLLQDSFEDDRSKILMVLCASPDPRDIHKTIGTLEYGAKAKCIVRCSSSPLKEKNSSQDVDPALLGARIMAMDDYISKLQMDNRQKEQEREEAQRELLKKEEEVAKLKEKLKEMQEKQSDKQEEIEIKVEEKARLLKLELLRKFEECQKSANSFVEFGKRKMEEKILQQQEEVEMLRRRLEEIESELSDLKNTPSNNHLRMDVSMEIERMSDITEAGELVASSARVLEGMQAYIQETKDKFLSQESVYTSPQCTIDRNRHYNSDFSHKANIENLANVNEDIKLDYKGELQQNAPEENESAVSPNHAYNSFDPHNKDERALIHERFPFLKLKPIDNSGSDFSGDDVEVEDHTEATRSIKRGWLPTVYEEEEEYIRDGHQTQEQTKATWAATNCRRPLISDFSKTQISNGFSTESKVGGHSKPKLQQMSCLQDCTELVMKKEVDEGESNDWASSLAKPALVDGDRNTNGGNVQTKLLGSPEPHCDPTVSRKVRIQNIFLLCGNPRELAKQVRTPPNKGNQCDDERSEAVDNLHDETPNAVTVRPSVTLTGSSNGYSPEVAGLVTPSFKSTSPQDARLTSWSSSPGVTTQQQLRSPQMLASGEAEMGVPRSKCLTLNDPVRPALTELTTVQQLESGFSHRYNQSEQQTKTSNDENQEEKDEKCDVYVKWEKSKEASGKLIQILKVSKNANLSDLRKMIEPHMDDKRQEFLFLLLGDPSGAPVSREKEASVPVTSLPDCHNERGSRLACLRLPSKRLLHSNFKLQEMPLNSLENKMPVSPVQPSPTSTIQSSNSSSPLLSTVQKPLLKIGNQTVGCGGKSGQKAVSSSLLKGLSR